MFKFTQTLLNTFVTLYCKNMYYIAGTTGLFMNQLLISFWNLIFKAHWLSKL